MKRFAFLVVIGVSNVLSAQLRPGHRVALDPGQLGRAVAKSFAERGIVIGPAQITLPAELLATESDPDVDVSAFPETSPLAPSKRVQSAVRVTCHQPQTCIPFYAIVTWNADGPRTADMAWKPRDRPARPVATVLASVAMRSGQSATLVLAGEGTKIQLTVVSLERGRVGQRIRVVHPGSHKIYTAEVMTAELLRGEL